jgi:hypothetical protein
MLKARGTTRIHLAKNEHVTDAEDSTTARYRYEQLAGDPLSLAPIEEKLCAAGSIDTNGYACADEWSRETAEHIYPTRSPISSAQCRRRACFIRQTCSLALKTVIISAHTLSAASRRACSPRTAMRFAPALRPF